MTDVDWRKANWEKWAEEDVVESNTYKRLELARRADVRRCASAGSAQGWR